MLNIIAGLGNKPSKYLQTRHNAGFWLVDLLAKKYDITLAPKKSANPGLEYGKEESDGWILCKPSEFINTSGAGIAHLARKNGIAKEAILVLHDEIDLPLGKLRIKFGGGHAGHNGLKDIAMHLGTLDFWRLRIGIGHPRGKMDVDHYVLSIPPKEEREIINNRLDIFLEQFETIIQGDINSAVHYLHTET